MTSLGILLALAATSLDGPPANGGPPPAAPIYVAQRQPLGDPNYGSVLGANSGFAAPASSGQPAAPPTTGFNTSPRTETSATASTSSNPQIYGSRPAGTTATTGTNSAPASSPYSDSGWNHNAAPAASGPSSTTGSDPRFSQWDSAARREPAGAASGNAGTTYNPGNFNAGTNAAAPYNSADPRGNPANSYADPNPRNPYAFNPYANQQTSNQQTGSNMGAGSMGGLGGYAGSVPDLSRRPQYGNDPNHMSQGSPYSDRDYRTATNPPNNQIPPLIGPGNTSGRANESTGGQGRWPANEDFTRPVSSTAPPVSAGSSVPRASQSPASSSGDRLTVGSGFPRQETTSPSDSRTSLRKATNDEEANSSLMLACFALFVSLSGNAYLTWICWGIHERYRKLANQMSRSTLRAHSETVD